MYFAAAVIVILHFTNLGNYHEKLITAETTRLADDFCATPVRDPRSSLPFTH